MLETWKAFQVEKKCLNEISSEKYIICHLWFFAGAHGLGLLRHAAQSAKTAQSAFGYALTKIYIHTCIHTYKQQKHAQTLKSK